MSASACLLCKCCGRKAVPAQQQGPSLSKQALTPVNQRVGRRAAIQAKCFAVQSSSLQAAPLQQPDVLLLRREASYAQDNSHAIEPHFSNVTTGADVVIVTRPDARLFAALADVIAGQLSNDGEHATAVCMSRLTYDDLIEVACDEHESHTRQEVRRAMDMLAPHIRLFSHSWNIAPGLTASRIALCGSAGLGMSVASHAVQGLCLTTAQLLSDFPPLRVLADAPVTLTKGSFVGATQEVVGDPWFSLNYEVDRRAGSAGRAKLLETVGKANVLHVFHEGAASCRGDTAGWSNTGSGITALREVQWHVEPEVLRFCPCRRV